MADAVATAHTISPDRASFTIALNTARDQIIHAAPAAVRVCTVRVELEPAFEVRLGRFPGPVERAEIVGQTLSAVRAPSNLVITHARPDLNWRARRSWLQLDAVSRPDPAVGAVSHALPADLSAVREARTLVRQVLGDWRADDIQDDVVLVASELVANALRHGMQVEQPRALIRARVSLEATAVLEPEGVRISLVSTGSHVICAVTDPSETAPVRRVPLDPLAGSGRGLQLVESLSLCWGWTVLDRGADGTSAGVVQGKSVWAMFPLDPPKGASRPQVVGTA